jgi:signal recognition particle receptor subunit beta
MAFVNYNNKEITVKIVYYGPALSGKTTCLKYIYDSGDYRKKGKLITLDTDGDRTLFFDFLPIEIGKLGDYSIKMQLYTVPGQVAYNTTRKLVLQGSDGIVFVADSQVVMREQNKDSFNNLKENLKANNIAFEESPLIFEYNKRDLREILPIDILNKDLNPENKPFFSTVGTSGENVIEALHTIMKMVIIHLKNKLSIFQKDKTVMFSRDEVTDSISKKASTQPAPSTSTPSPPKQDVSEPESAPLTVPEEPEISDTEKEEIFELSSPMPMSDEPLKTRDYPKLQPEVEEDIFNLGDESRLGSSDEVVSGGLDVDVPEAVMDVELGGDEHHTEAIDLSASDRLEDSSEPVLNIESDVEELGQEYELKSDDIVLGEPESGFNSDDIAAPPEPTISPASTPPPPTDPTPLPTFTANISQGIDVPIHIEIPEDKDEIKINLNLQIVIKKKN